MVGIGVFASEITPLYFRGEGDLGCTCSLRVLGQNLFFDFKTLLLSYGLPFLSSALLLHTFHLRCHKITELCRQPPPSCG